MSWQDRTIEGLFLYEVVLNNGNRKNLKYLRTTFPNITLSTTNPKRTGLGLNQHLCGKRLEYSLLSDCINVELSGISLMDIKGNVVSQY